MEEMAITLQEQVSISLKIRAEGVYFTYGLKEGVYFPWGGGDDFP